MALGSVAACCQGDACCLGHEPVPLDKRGLSSPTLLPSPILGDQEPKEHTFGQLDWGLELLSPGGTVGIIQNPQVGVTVAAERDG